MPRSNRLTLSGKDYTKVDRSAAYAARWVAKSLVKAGLCRRCLVQVGLFLLLACVSATCISIALHTRNSHRRWPTPSESPSLSPSP